MIPTSNNEQGPAAAALLLLLLGTATAVTAVKPSSPLTRTIEILSDPITLKYGQVNNRYQEPISLPEDVVAQFANNGTMAIVDYKVDIVDEDGNQVPLYDIYNHHYGIIMGSHDFAEGVYNFTKDAPYGVPPPKDLVGWVNENASFSQPDDYFRNEGRRLMMMTSMMSMSSSLYDFDFSAGFGGGSGAEERGTSHKLPDGYAWMIHQPEAMTALFHFINTRAPPNLPRDQLKEGETSKLLECPCTPQRVIDVANVSVDGVSPFPPFGTCNAQLMQDNPSCQISTYQGGWRCCEDGVFVIDTDKVDTADLPEDTVYGKLILTYLDGDAEDMDLKNARGGGFDATGSLDTRGNVEFDVPQCKEGTLPEDCVYQVSTVTYLDSGVNATDDALVEMPYAVAHLHASGIDMSMYNEETGELICRSEAVYGNGTEAGNEDGYLVGMTPCVFDDPPQLRKNSKIRTVARYNATEPHTGVMALWLPQLHDLPQA